MNFCAFQDSAAEPWFDGEILTEFIGLSDEGRERFDSDTVLDNFRDFGQNILQQNFNYDLAAMVTA